MSAAPTCKRCNRLIPDGKLACEACAVSLSHVMFQKHQLRYAADIATDGVELTVVWLSAGSNGQNSPLWHLQRFGDIRHAYCNADLPAGRRQDHLKYSQLYQLRPPLCPACAAALDEVVQTVPKHDLPTHRAEITPIRG